MRESNSYAEPEMLSLVAVFGTLTGLAFSLALLFLPTLVAKSRHHPNTAAIFLVNLFFGWTFIGWVIAAYLGVHAAGGGGFLRAGISEPRWFHDNIRRSRIPPYLSFPRKRHIEGQGNGSALGRHPLHHFRSLRVRKIDPGQTGAVRCQRARFLHQLHHARASRLRAAGARVSLHRPR